VLDVVSMDGKVNLYAVPYYVTLDESLVDGWKDAGKVRLPLNAQWPVWTGGSPVAVEAVVELNASTPIPNLKYVAEDTDYAELIGYSLYGLSVLPFIYGIFECFESSCGPWFYYPGGGMLGAAGFIWLGSETDALVGTDYLYYDDQP
jgi:hypothetical protein